jgi:alginate O-acetyltransferase complex protein AlgI
MTLGTWFREYLYIPLGGNRRGVPRQIFNLFVVWFLTGLWHGAGWNFILWGLYYFLLLLLEKFVLKKWLEQAPSILRHLYTLFFVVLGWVLFACEDMGVLGSYLKAMFGVGVPFVNTLAQYEWEIYLPFLLILAIAGTAFPCRVGRDITTEEQRPRALGIYTLLVFVLSLAYLVSGGYNPFLYFRF